MKINILLSLIIFGSMIFISGYVEAQEKKSDKLQKVFNSRMDGPVDAAWNANRRCIYVANNNGFFSIPGIEGQGDTQQDIKKAVTVIEFPKHRFDNYEYYYLPNFEIGASCGGILLDGDTLYVVDIQKDKVKLYDLNSETTVDEYYVNHNPDSLKLRDLCLDTSGTFYITNRSEDGIFSKDQSSASFTKMELTGEELREPVGMYFDSPNNRLLVVEFVPDSACIKAVDLENDSVYTVMQTPYGKLVGITMDGHGYYHISSQYKRGSNAGGDIYRIDTAFTGELEPWYDNQVALRDIVCIPETDTIIIARLEEVHVMGLIYDRPATLYPGNNTTDLENEIEFKWKKCQHAEAYEMQISTSSNFTDPEFHEYRWNTDTVLTIEGLNMGTEYYWRVRARSGFARYQSEWSDTSSFSISDTIKSGPVLTSPQANEANVQDKVTFQWNPVAGSGEYHIQVAKDMDFEDIEFEDYSTTNTVSYKYLDLEKQYYWKVKATGGSGGTIWSEPSTFTTKEPELDQVELTDPYDRTMDLPLNLELSWDAVDNASYYVIQIEPDEVIVDNPFGTFVDDTTSNLLYSMDGLFAEGDFKWRVKAVNGDSTGKWSEVWEFITTDTILQPPVPITHGDEPVETLPTFNWTNVNADYYEIQVADYVSSDLKVNFINPVIQRNYISDTSYTVEMNLQPDTKYLWRVRSEISNRASSAWSEPAEFITMKNTKVTDITTSGLNLQVIPNPVNRNAVIRLENAELADVILSLYDALGKEIRVVYSGRPQPGVFDLDFNTDNLNSGIYYLTLRQGNLSISRKVILSK